MKDSYNIVHAYCSVDVQEKLLYLYNNLKNQGLIPQGINFEQNGFDIESNNLFFMTYSKSNEHNLRDFINRLDFKKCQIVIISNDEENYFDFAIECNICNIIYINNLSETILLGTLKRFLKEELCLEPFFEHKKNIFDKCYSLHGNICIQNLVEDTFAEFIEKIPDNANNPFIIDSHELITNAFAYGVLGINSSVRDVRASDIGKYMNVPEGKDVKVHLLLNEDFYGISVTDPGGALTSSRIMERIRRQSIVAGETIPQGIEDYTGRGLAILSHHGILLFSLNPGKFTTVSLISQTKAPFEKKAISILTSSN
jgi:hypothetical protein